ncbi:MAG TPA: AraC family transcriptional regulator [Rariglobus sp.]|jgi:AraC-like DNA-binding protein|nr:AraC family transcriptional regulator [Rariglobus sp.]
MGKSQQTLREIHQIGKRTREFLIHPEHCPALKKYHVSLAGISQTTPQFRFINPAATHSQILVGLKGCGKVLLQDGWHDCTPGKAYCTPRGKLNAYTGAYGCEFGWITYQPSTTWRLTEPVLLEVDPRPLETILRGLHLEVTTQRDPTLLEHWTELLQMHGRRIIESRQPARLWQLWQKVQANLATPWTLQLLSEAAGIGPEYLRRLSLSENGTTPMKQVTRLRMQQAVSLLSKGYTVEAIAKEVGYENAFAFSTAFKRTIGQSPSHFHKQT